MFPMSLFLVFIKNKIVLKKKRERERWSLGGGLLVTGDMPLKGILGAQPLPFPLLSVEHLAMK
jgi:hypothetical protein